MANRTKRAIKVLNAPKIPPRHILRIRRGFTSSTTLVPNLPMTQQPTFVKTKRKMKLNATMIHSPKGGASELLIAVDQPKERSKEAWRATQKVTATKMEKKVPASLQIPAINPRLTPKKVPKKRKAKKRTSKIQPADAKSEFIGTP